MRHNRLIRKSTIDKRINVSMYYQRRACNDRKRQRKKGNSYLTKIKRLFTDFYKDPENSCEPPGKRDYVKKTKKGTY